MFSSLIAAPVCTRSVRVQRVGMDLDFWGEPLLVPVGASDTLDSIRARVLAKMGVTDPVRLRCGPCSWRGGTGRRAGTLVGFGRRCRASLCRARLQGAQSWKWFLWQMGKAEELMANQPLGDRLMRMSDLRCGLGISMPRLAQRGGPAAYASPTAGPWFGFLGGQSRTSAVNVPPSHCFIRSCRLVLAVTFRWPWSIPTRGPTPSDVRTTGRGTAGRTAAFGSAEECRRGTMYRGGDVSKGHGLRAGCHSTSVPACVVAHVNACGTGD